MPRTRKPRRGRPPLDPTIRKGRPIPVRARPDQAAQIDELAALWALDRTAAILRAVDEAHTRATRTTKRGGK